ncbi:MAG: hypothetical protein J6R82_00750 [Clostridia bacterium]|nr:hypothetical protein [Clostridia bacterium]
MKYTVRMIALLVAGVFCLSTLMGCDIGLAEKLPDSTEPSHENSSPYADLSPAQLYQQLLEGEGYIAVAQLDTKKVQSKGMLRKILHKDEDRVFVRTEESDGKVTTRKTDYIDLGAALRYTQEEGKWVCADSKGGREGMTDALNELLTITEKIPTDRLLADENYGKPDADGVATLTESALKEIFGDNKSEASYAKTQEDGAYVYTLSAMVVEKGVRYTLTFSVRFVDTTVEMPKVESEEEPKPPVTKPPVTTPPIPPVTLPGEEIDPPVTIPEEVDPPVTNIPEADPVDAKALIDRADELMTQLDSYIIKTDQSMAMDLIGDTVIYTRLHELRADIAGKRVQEIVSESYLSQQTGISTESEGVKYYDQDVYMLETDGIKEYAPMEEELLNLLIGELMATVPTDLSVFQSVTVTEVDGVYMIDLFGLKEDYASDAFISGLLGDMGEGEIDCRMIQIFVEINKRTGLYQSVFIDFVLFADLDTVGYTEIYNETLISYTGFNKTVVKKPSTDGYTLVPLESLIG